MPAVRAGRVDSASRDVIAGWARDTLSPEEPVALQVLDNGALIARVLANRYRGDLKDAGFGSGRHAFEWRAPGGLSPLQRHVIQVHYEADGTEMEGSPLVIEAASRFDSDMQRGIAAAIDGLATGPEQAGMLSFLAAQADRLVQRQAEAAGGSADRLAWRQWVRRAGLGQGCRRICSARRIGNAEEQTQTP